MAAATTPLPTIPYTSKLTDGLCLTALNRLGYRVQTYTRVAFGPTNETARTDMYNATRFTAKMNAEVVFACGTTRDRFYGVALPFAHRAKKKDCARVHFNVCQNQPAKWLALDCRYDGYRRCITMSKGGIEGAKLYVRVYVCI